MNTWRLHSLPDLKDRSRVFRDRQDAGDCLADMLREFRNSKALVVGIPAGGVPVAARIYERLQLPLVITPVSKILFPWTTESGFGAVAFDGTEWINADMVAAGNLDAKTIAIATEAARAKVNRRVELLYGDQPLPDFNHKTVIVVDDGIAAGSTMRAAINALHKAGTRKLIIAVPTGHDRTLNNLLDQVDSIYCANKRSGYSFAVAEAYEHWYDVPEEEVVNIVQQFKK